MLTWISENAKWVIYISMAGIVAGLLFMDMSSLQLDNRPPVGTVNGEKLSNDLFDNRLRQIQSQQVGLSDEQAAQMREELFRSFVQQHLMQKVIEDLKITASVYEMSRDLRTDPPQGIDREPTFQTNNVFDFAKYEEWLANPATYDIPFMQEYENMLKTIKIPEKQLRVFVGAGVHQSTLEAKYKVLKRETKFDLFSAQGNVKDFDSITVSQNAIDSVFKAQTDSFFVADDLAKVRYVSIAIEPSNKDIESTYDYAKLLLAQIQEGADFADIARSSSDDQGSAAQGGELGDYSARGKWVPEFDSAAFALDSGAISDPIRTQFGYHIIQSLGKRIENEQEQVKARHILLAVNATAETIDSLEAILNEIKIEVDNKTTLDSAAKSKGLTVATSNWFRRGGEVSELGYMSGLSSYAFFNPLRPKETSKTSEILQNSKHIALFESASYLKAGERSEEFAKPKIEESLKAKAKAASIAEYLKANSNKLAEITVLDSISKKSIEKVTIDSTTVSFENYLPGLGYANAEIYSALTNAKEAQWNGPYISGSNAVMLKILKKHEPSQETIDKAIKNELTMTRQYGAFSAFNEYMKTLENGADIVNNLDLYYRE